MHADDQPWRAQGLCRNMDPNIFFPSDGAGVDEAVAICRTCPVREPCAEWGIANEVYGVWGGMGERERRRARRKGNVARTLEKPRTRGRPAA